MADDNSTVEKVAGRMSLDIAPFEQSLAQMEEDFKQFGANLIAIAEENGNAEILALQSSGAQKQNLTATQQARIQQIEEDGNLKRLLAQAAFEQQSEQSAQEHEMRLRVLEEDGQAARELLWQTTTVKLLADMQQNEAKQEEMLQQSALKKQAMSDRIFQQQEQHEARMQALQANSQRAVLALEQAQEKAKQAELDAEEKAQAASVSNQLKQIKAYYDMKMTTAQEALAQIEELMNEEVIYFTENEDKKIQAMKMSYKIQQDMQSQYDALDKAHFRALQEDYNRDVQSQHDAIDAKLKQIKAYYDMNLTTAQEASKQLEDLWVQESDFFQQNLDQRLQAMKMYVGMQGDIAKQETLGGQGSVRSAVNGSDTGFSTMNMIGSMIGFQAVMGAYNQMVEGMKEIENGAAGLHQVFEDQIGSQQQLNQVTGEFVDVAQKYGASINDVMDGAKLWGRQYKDINEALTLTNSSTLLSIVDNVKLADANKGLESTMNSMGMAANNQASAFANSMRIVDSWSALAHKASVSADDLVQATERASGAAHTAGVTFDQLQALITSGVRNTGLDGANIGNMLKSLFASINTQAAQKQLETLGIKLTEVGKNGETVFRPTFDVLLELSQKLQTDDKSAQKLLETISGGKYQWSKAADMLGDYNTILDAYATSINSAGSASQYAQVQMDTLSRDIQRLRDTFAQLAEQADNNGLGAFLKTIVNGLTELIIGLEQMPPAAGETLAVIGGLLVVVKSLASVMNSFDPVVRSIVGLWNTFTGNAKGATVATAQQTAAIEANTAATTQLATAMANSTQVTEAKTAATETQTTAEMQQTSALGAETAAIETNTTATTEQTSATEAATAAIKQEQVAIAQTTSELEAMATAEGAAGAAAEVQAASSAAVVGGLEAETAAATETTAAFTALDVVSGGLTLAIGAVVAVLAGVAISHGQATKAAQDHTQAIHDQIGVAQQQLNLVQQQQKFMETAVQQEQNLKKALDDTTLSAQNRQKVMTDLVDLYHAVGKATDDEALKQVNASNVKDQSLSNEQTAINKLVNAKMTAYSNAIEADRKQAQSDLDATNSAITNAEAKIKAIQNETTAKLNELSVWEWAKAVMSTEQDIFDPVKLISDVKTFMKTGSLPEFANVQQQHHDQALSDTEATLNSLKQKQAQLQKQLADDALAKFQLDTGGMPTPGDQTGQLGVYPGFDSTKQKADSAAAFARPYTDAIKAITDALGPFDNKNKELDASLAELTAKQQTYADELKYGSTNTNLAAEETDLYKQRLSTLKEAQDALHQTNNTIRADMDSIQAKMHALNPDNADPTTLSQGAQQAYSALSQEYDKLSQKADANSKKWVDDQKAAITATDDWTNAIIKLEDNAMKPLDDKMKEIDNRIKSDKAGMSLSQNAMKNGDYSTDTVDRYVNDYKDQLDGLYQKQQLIHQEAEQHRTDIANLQQQIASLDPTTAGFAEAVQIMTNKIQEHQAAISDLQDQYQQTAASIDSLKQSMLSGIENDLKAGYQVEYQNQLKQLSDAHTTRLNQLNAEKSALDEQIQDLQQQNQLIDEQNKLNDLKNQLSNVEGNTDHVYIKTDGTVSYTYDTQKATEIQKQIDDQQTKMDRDKQKQDLEDKKAALDQQIKDENDTYNTQKANLDAYWKYRMQTDQLQQEADRLLIKEGYGKAVADAQKFAKDMNDAYNTIDYAKINAGAGVSSTLGITNSGGYASAPTGATTGLSATGPTHEYGMSDSDYQKFISNSAVWSAASPQQQAQLHQDNDSMRQKYGIPDGVIPKFKDGGMVPNVSAGIDRIPALVSPGEIMIPSFADLKQLAIDSVKTSVGGGAQMHKSVHFDKAEIHVHDVSGQAQAIVEVAVEKFADMLNEYLGA